MDVKIYTAGKFSWETFQDSNMAGWHALSHPVECLDSLNLGVSKIQSEELWHSGLCAISGLEFTHTLHVACARPASCMAWDTWCLLWPVQDWAEGGIHSCWFGIYNKYDLCRLVWDPCCTQFPPTPSHSKSGATCSMVPRVGTTWSTIPDWPEWVPHGLDLACCGGRGHP